jgi:flagellar biosynthesis/type III secretory pathway M-ring protein FliF/YscJ
MTDNYETKGRMAVGIVIVISMAIALGVVLFLVFFGLLLALARRRREESEKSSNVSAEDDTDPLTEKKKRPALVLAAVGAATVSSSFLAPRWLLCWVSLSRKLKITDAVVLFDARRPL